MPRSGVRYPYVGILSRYIHVQIQRGNRFKLFRVSAIPSFSVRFTVFFFSLLQLYTGSRVPLTEVLPVV